MSAADFADLVVRSRRVVTPAGVGPAAIHIQEGRIIAVKPFNDVSHGSCLRDAGNSAVMPGVVDTHVHINEPGRADWEGFSCATRAAAAGGVTSLVDMPLNSIPPTTTVAGLQAKLAAAQGQLFVDVAFWGGVVPGNAAELRGLIEAGVCGFKCFLVPSGVPEFPLVAESDLRAVLPQLASTGAVLLFHAESPGPIERAAWERPRNSRTNCYAGWLASRPREAENEAIAMVARLAREFGLRAHVVHLFSSDAIPILRRGKMEGLALTAETCPHYLFFATEEIPDAATEFKCAPPVRERENREKLWAALGEGWIDLIVSDHSPCPPEMKRRDSGDFLRAWGGISSLELSLRAVWTEARKRGFSLQHLAKWMCAAPARLAGLEKRKGILAVGYDADLVVWDPEARFRVEPQKLHQRHKLTPYAHHMLSGVVEATYLRGQKFTTATNSRAPLLALRYCEASRERFCPPR